VPVQSWQPAVSLVFSSSSVPNHGRSFEFACGSNDDLDFSSNPSSFYNPSAVGFLPVAAVLAQFHDHLVSWLDSDRYSDSNSLPDRLAVRSDHVLQSHRLPTHAVLLVLEFFFDNILEHFMFQTQICIHLFQSPIFFF